MAELKPCPFCGREAKICNGSNEIVGSQYEIRCKSLNCTMRPKTEWHESLEEAIEHWNTRASEAEIRARVVDEFAEKMSLEISESIIWDMLITMNESSSISDTSDKIVDYVIDTAREIAEQMKKEVERE